MGTSRHTARLAAVAVAVGALGAGSGQASAAATRTTTHTQPGSVTILDPYTGDVSPDTLAFDATAGPADVYPSRITVPATAGTVTDVTVYVDSLTHAFPDDVDLLLQGPGGQRVVLMSDAGGDADVTAAWLHFDDAADGGLPDDTALVSGSYRPTDHDPGGDADAFPAPAPDPSGAGSSLAVFDGTDPSGIWSLYAVDDKGGDAGSLTGWELDISLSGTTPYPSTLSVGGVESPVTDVDLVLHSLDHTWVADVDVLLVGPGGRRAVVMSDAGEGEGAVDATFTLDDEAAQPLPATTAPTDGSVYRPADYGSVEDTFPGVSSAGAGSALSAFDGTDANGTWQLYVTDDFGRDTGDISGGWSLRITTGTTDLPAPADTVAPTAGVVIDAGKARTMRRTVALAVTASDAAPSSGVARMRFSNDGTTWSAFEPFAAQTSWTLAPGDGPKTVRVQVSDGAGNVSAPAADSILLDTTGPRVRSTRPGWRATGVRRGANIRAVLEEAVRPGTVSRSTVRLTEIGTRTAVRVRVRYVAAKRKIVVDPRRRLAAGTTYQVRIRRGVKDLAGNRLDQRSRAGNQAKVWRFTTR
jgi:subtilisin-like proprotein convertase family protein